jgi:predicted unusual protein kinase regulating ubiquinone biosynthesis (AarF/ABC1/UbiB family)
MSDIPRRAVTRSAKMAALPLGMAGRAAAGFGKRVMGVSADEIAADLQQRAAAQVFATLGELKGGAMKFGQAMSIFESALPEEVAGPYRAMLTKLQDNAPPLPVEAVHAQLSEALGADWRDRFADFDDRPAAAASIGQVHRATWRDGRDVAVKIQYPGAAQALRSDLKTMQRLGSMFMGMAPGLDYKALMAEVAARMDEELDYLRESNHQRAFAVAYEGDEQFAVPHVLAANPTVLVTEWMDGTPLSQIIDSGTQAQRDHAGRLYLEFLLSSPERAGLMHADPHPGNYRITPDGRLGILDFGAVARLPDGLPGAMGNLTRIAMMGSADDVLAGLRAEGFIREGIDVDPEALLDYLGPFVDPVEYATFRFSRDWMRAQFNRINDPRKPEFMVGLKINLPPSYMLIHRVWLGGIGVLSQLGAEVPMRSLFERWVPGYLEHA